MSSGGEYLIPLFLGTSGTLGILSCSDVTATGRLCSGDRDGCRLPSGEGTIVCELLEFPKGL